MIKKVVYIAAALALLAFTAVRLKSNKEKTASRVYQYDREKPISVQADTVKPAKTNYEHSYTGFFEPGKETKISADIQGKVIAVPVDLGARVRKGQLLVQLDNSLLKLQLESVETQIEGLEADVKRYTVLTQADAIQGVQLEKAELGLKTTKVQRATLLEQIEKTAVRAPFNGIITAKMTEQGAFAAPGVPLIQVTDISNLKFTVYIPEYELRLFQSGQTSPVVADVYPEIPLTGRAVMVGSKANNGNSFPVQFEVKNTPDLKIKSGMFGKTTLKNDSGEEQIIIPASVIVGSGSMSKVYLIKNGKAVLQNVRVEKRFENKAVISEGLEKGDVIVVSGLINLFDGASINLKPMQQ